MAVYIVVGVFILFDIGTGLLKAVFHGDINSTELRKGLYHKLSEIIAMIGSGLLEYGITYIKLGVDIPVLNVVGAYLCIMELVSILENLGDVNPALAKLFKPYLKKLKEKEGENYDAEKRD